MQNTVTKFYSCVVEKNMKAEFKDDRGLKKQIDGGHEYSCNNVVITSEYSWVGMLMGVVAVVILSQDGL